MFINVFTVGPPREKPASEAGEDGGKSVLKITSISQYLNHRFKYLNIIFER